MATYDILAEVGAKIEIDHSSFDSGIEEMRAYVESAIAELEQRTMNIKLKAGVDFLNAKGNPTKEVTEQIQQNFDAIQNSVSQSMINAKQSFGNVQSNASKAAKNISKSLGSIKISGDLRDQLGNRIFSDAFDDMTSSLKLNGEQIEDFKQNVTDTYVELKKFKNINTENGTKFALSGVDELGRTVEMIKSYRLLKDKTGLKYMAEVGSSINYSFDNKDAISEQNAAYSELQRNIKEITSLQKSLNKEQLSPNVANEESINNIEERLKKLYDRNKEIERDFGDSFSDAQNKRLSELLDKENYNVLQNTNKLNDTAQIKEQQTSYNDLITTINKMDSLKTSINKELLSDNTNTEKVALMTQEFERLAESKDKLDKKLEGTLSTAQIENLSNLTSELDSKFNMMVSDAKKSSADAAAAAAEKDQIAAQKQGYQELTETIKRMASVKTDINKELFSDNTNTEKVALMTQEFERLAEKKDELDKKFSSGFSSNQIENLSELTSELDYKFEKLVADNNKSVADKANASSIKEQETAYKNLISTIEEMHNIEKSFSVDNVAEGDRKMTEAQVSEKKRQYDDLIQKLKEYKQAAGELTPEQKSNLGDVYSRQTKEINEAILAEERLNQKTANQNAIKEQEASYKKLISTIKEMYDIERQLAVNGADQTSGMNEERLTELKNRYSELISQFKEYKQAAGELTPEQKTNISEMLKKEEAAVRQEILAEKELGEQRAKIMGGKAVSSSSSFEIWCKNNSKAVKAYEQNVKSLREELNGLITRSKNGEDIGKELDVWNSKFEGLKNQALLEDNTGLTFFDKLKEQAKQYSRYISVATVMYKAMNAFKKMYNNVKEVDVAMTELRKVTDETEATYDQFLDNAIGRSKELGTTVKGYVESTADFARLGFTVEESANLAEVANIYANVGDDVKDVETATQSIVSTMKAFNINADDAITIVDKFNEVGNNFAISSGGIGDAMIRSAAAFKASNNTIDESIALITAANEIAQDPEKVGNAFTTLTMRIRGAKTDLEEAGLII